MGDTKLASGLKEALKVGTENTVAQTGKSDGYLKNEAIKILLPGKLQMVEKGLQMAGKGNMIDDLVTGMNRAAEAAAPKAKPIFGDAILEMTFDDARKIFSGGDTAATDYFKSKTSEKLTTAFKPVIQESMANIGVHQQYEQVMGKYLAMMPFGKKDQFDLTGYVVGKALDGLFHVLGEEEKKIRTDPAAQVTGLLKEVFGKK